MSENWSRRILALACGVTLSACSDPSDDGQGVSATLNVRTHHRPDGSFQLDEELELPGGDRVQLTHADPELAGKFTDENGQLRQWSVGSHRVQVLGELRENVFEATRVEREESDDDVRQVVQPVLDVFGERDTLVVLIGFPGNPNTYDPAGMKNGVFGEEGSTNALYREASRDQMWLGGIEDPGGDVWGPYEAPTDGCSTLSYSEVSDLALDAAEADGIDVDAYDHRVYAFPPVGSCPGGGIGGGNQVWVFGIGPQAIWDWVGHEAAHGFGFAHASSYDDCTVAGDPITIGGACEHNEYGDPTDIQGRRNFQFSSWHMERAGWLQPENVAVVDGSERIVLVPMETESSGIQSVRVPRDGGQLEEEFFHFEYRQPIGFDAGLESTLTNGVLVRAVVHPDNHGNTHLLDMTPDTSDNTDAALAVGRSFEDGNLEVTVVEASPERAVLDIIIDDIPPVIGTGGSDNGGTGGTPTMGAGGEPTATTGGAPGSGTGGDGAVTSGGSGALGTGGAESDVPATGGWVAATGGVSNPTSDASAPSEDGGCGCRTAPGSGPSPFSAFSLCLAFWAFVRARRSGRSSFDSVP